MTAVRGINRASNSSSLLRYILAWITHNKRLFSNSVYSLQSTERMYLVVCSFAVQQCSRALSMEGWNWSFLTDSRCQNYQPISTIARCTVTAAGFEIRVYSADQSRSQMSLILAILLIASQFVKIDSIHSELLSTKTTTYDDLQPKSHPMFRLRAGEAIVGDENAVISSDPRQQRMVPPCNQKFLNYSW